MNTLKVGTFAIRGNMRNGYRVVDLDTFNNWGTMPTDASLSFKTRTEACEHAQNCHDFKTGKRMNYVR